MNHHDINLDHDASSKSSLEYAAQFAGRRPIYNSPKFAGSISMCTYVYAMRGLFCTEDREIIAPFLGTAHTRISTVLPELQVSVK